MWKNKKHGFIVTNVEFAGGWASFISSGISCIMEEVSFKAHYEKC